MFNQSLEHVMVMLPRTRTVALRCIKYTCSCKWTLPWTLLFHPTPPQDWWSKCDVWACLSHIGVRMCAQLDPCAQFSWIRADVSGSLQAQTHSKMTNICSFMALSAEKVTPRDYQYLSLGWGLSSSGRDLWPVAKPWPGCVITANAWLSMWWYGGLINPSHAIASNNRFYRSWLHGSWIFVCGRMEYTGDHPSSGVGLQRSQNGDVSMKAGKMYPFLFWLAKIWSVLDAPFRVSRSKRHLAVKHESHVHH